MFHSESMPLTVAAGIAGRKRTNAHTANARRRTNPASQFLGRSLRNPAVSLGIFLGACFSAAGLAWLLLANRVASLDQFAFERNLSLAAAFGLLGLVPTCRFRRSPASSFLCGIIAWGILSATYSAAELYFPPLGARLGAFHLFVFGAALLGLLPVSAWVLNLVILLRKRSFR